MKRLFALTAVAALMLMPGSAHAVGSKAYDFCGGSYSGYTGFAFCASVTVTVTSASTASDGLYHAPGAYTVSMDIVNKSGQNGSFLNSMFIQIGLDNLVNDLATPTNVQISQGGNVICTNVTDNLTGKAKCYNVQENKTAAGGVRLDFLASASAGVSQYAITSCTASVTGLHSCANSPVRISFDVTKNFDPNDGVQVYVKSQGQLGSTECETGTNAISCGVPPTTVTPEPATIGLLATGFVGILFAGHRRRKSAAA
jgi:hypothetical protein